MDADAEYRKSKLRISKCAAGADLCPVGGVVAGAALVQGAAVQEGEHAAPRRRAAANHSSASPYIQPITAHLAVSRVDTKHCSVTASSRASRGDATSRKSRFTLFKLKHYYYYIIIFNVLPYLQSDV